MPVGSSRQDKLETLSGIAFALDLESTPLLVWMGILLSDIHTAISGNPGAFLGGLVGDYNQTNFFEEDSLKPLNRLLGLQNAYER